MPRKKPSDDASESQMPNEFENLGDGEEITIQDTRKIRKTVSQAPPKTVEAELVEEDDDADDDRGEPFFAESSIAGMLLADEENPLQQHIANIIIKRNPDSFGDHFLTPNESQLSMPPMRNVDITLETSVIDTEEKVRKLYGGGHYFFQVQLAGKIWRSWKSTLSDLPEAIEKAKADAIAAQQPAQLTSSQPASIPTAQNSFDQFLETIEKQNRLKNALFGEEMKELEELRRSRQTQTDNAPQQSEKLQILEYAQKLPAAMQEKVLGFVFEDDSGGGILETAKWIFDNGDTVIGFGEKLFGALLGGNSAGAMQPTELEAMLRKTPPAGHAAESQKTAAPNASRSNFKRRKPAETAPAEKAAPKGETTDAEKPE